MVGVANVAAFTGAVSDWLGVLRGKLAFAPNFLLVGLARDFAWIAACRLVISSSIV
jgi:hypothetical protein